MTEGVKRNEKTHYILDCRREKRLLHKFDTKRSAKTWWSQCYVSLSCTLSFVAARALWARHADTHYILDCRREKRLLQRSSSHHTCHSFCRCLCEKTRPLLEQALIVLPGALLFLPLTNRVSWRAIWYGRDARWQKERRETSKHEEYTTIFIESHLSFFLSVSLWENTTSPRAGFDCSTRSFAISTFDESRILKSDLVW